MRSPTRSKVLILSSKLGIMNKICAVNVQFQKISILWKVLLFYTNLSLGNSSLASYIASKILTFKTPLPRGIPDDLLWGGCQFFMKPHNSIDTSLQDNIFLWMLLKYDQPDRSVCIVICRTASVGGSEFFL